MTAAIFCPNARPRRVRQRALRGDRAAGAAGEGEANIFRSPNCAPSSPAPICLFRLNLQERGCENNRPRRLGRRCDRGLCAAAWRRPDAVRGAWVRLGDRARDRAQLFWPPSLVRAIEESLGRAEEDGRADLQQRIENGKDPPKDLYGAIGVKAVVIGHLLVRLAGGVSSSQPNFPADAARSDRQGRPKAVARRLALDGREHSVKLPQSGDTGVSRPFGSVSTTATLPREFANGRARRASRTCIRSTTKVAP